MAPAFFPKRYRQPVTTLHKNLSIEKTDERIQHTKNALNFLNTKTTNSIIQDIISELEKLLILQTGVLHYVQQKPITQIVKKELDRAWRNEIHGFHAFTNYLTHLLSKTSNTNQEITAFLTKKIPLGARHAVLGKDLILYLQLSINYFYPAFNGDKSGIDYEPVDPNDANTITLNSGHKERVENLSDLMGLRNNPYTGRPLTYLDRINICAQKTTSSHDLDLILLEEDSAQMTILIDKKSGEVASDKKVVRVMHSLFTQKSLHPPRYVLNGRYIQAFHLLTCKGLRDFQEILSVQNLNKIQSTVFVFVEELVKSRIRYWFSLKRRHPNLFKNYSASTSIMYNMIISGITDHRIKANLPFEQNKNILQPYLTSLCCDSDAKNFKENHLKGLTQVFIKMFVQKFNASELLNLDWSSLIPQDNENMRKKVSQLLKEGLIDVRTALTLNHENYDKYQIRRRIPHKRF